MPRIGRKLGLALLITALSFVLALRGQLTGEWVAVASAVFAFFSAADSYITVRQPPEVRS